MGNSKKTISEIKKMILEKKYSEEDWAEFQSDDRKGVKELLAKEQRKKEQIEKVKELHKEMSVFEERYSASGFTTIAGVDEVGRGPLAGPVVASAVILDGEKPIYGLQDSKKLSTAKLEELYEAILENSVSVGIGVMTPEEIDELNIYHATKKAMQKAVHALSVSPDFLLVDAMELPLSIQQESLIKGDARSISIAAASIVAKVTRDRMMEKLAVRYPQYGFERHVGYGTKEHLTALDRYGVTNEHRKTFAPVRERLGML
ncbi:ribonuclease HII [Alkalihalobacillus sp. CinArs1]|uniref:ribonuclease HII n=1 Tax=Alkalihalobacillus sp. CinArs1 TaxID=2995314 RepID=UPI0022DD2102|nr:ribonuclease HII [Alkalihalobacillus sp. CinArs1]